MCWEYYPLNLMFQNPEKTLRNYLFYEWTLTKKTREVSVTSLEKVSNLAKVTPLLKASSRNHLLGTVSLQHRYCLQNVNFIASLFASFPWVKTGPGLGKENLLIVQIPHAIRRFTGLGDWQLQRAGGRQRGFDLGFSKVMMDLIPRPPSFCPVFCDVGFILRLWIIQV